MADYPILTSADGSTSINVGSVMLADGVDYGMAGMFTNGMGGNPFIDGGNLGFRFSGPRMFKFPIRLATVGNMTPAGVAKVLAQIAQPGAWVDLMLSNAAGGQVATADAVRFDIIDGRVRQNQDVKMWAGAGRREGVLELDVQPYGYLPTWITLASSASVGLPGRLTIPGASIIGDVPGLAKINVYAVLASQQIVPGATYGYDMFAYALGNKAPAFIPAASLTSVLTTGLYPGLNATLTGDAAAPGSQIFRVFMSPSVSVYYPVQTGYLPLVRADMNPTYAGRYRLHAFARNVSPSSGLVVPLAADAGPQYWGTGSAIASGGLVASLGQPLTLASDGAYTPIPTGFGFFPFGDITIPSNGTVMQQSVTIWGIAPTQQSISTHVIDFGGFWLQSIDAGQGIVARDLQVPGIANSATYFNPYPFSIDAYARDVNIHTAGNSLPAVASFQVIALSSQVAGRSLLDRYRGVMPQVSPSLLSMDIMAAARRLQNAYRQEVLTDLPRVWWRFNEPSGAATVIDWSGNGLHGAASNMLLGASSLLYGEPGGATGVIPFAQSASSGSIPFANQPRTLEAWYSPASVAAVSQTVAQLGQTNTGQMALYVASGAAIFLTGAGTPSYAYRWQVGQTIHLAAAYSGTHVQLYVNGQAIGATQTFAAALNTVGNLMVGNIATGGLPAPGGIDEVAVYPVALTAARVLAHYVAGRNTQGATSAPVYHQGGYAGVSLRYQPRFTFQKEI